MYLNSLLPMLSILLWSTTTTFALPSPSQSLSPNAFTYTNTTFLLHGQPYQIRAGQMDPQRIHPAYWRRRFQMAKAMGLNTIFTYVFWDLIEPRPGEFDFVGDPSGRNDVAEYCRQAQEEGLNVVLRAGPYADAERDWGGLPAWLMEVEGMVVRSYNKPFLDASKRYLTRLADEVRDLQVTNVGPILMVQVENEYGSYGSDHKYTAALRDIFQPLFDVPLFTDDGGGKSYLDGGQIPDVLAEVDGDPKIGFKARDKYVTRPSSLGPLLDAEYYTTWLDLWASNYSYQTTAGHPRQQKQVYDDIDWILSNKDSFSLYMFHGGTNFGFENGALRADAGYLEPVTSSYDYGAPLDESGRTTELYHGIRNVIEKHLPVGEELPPVPKDIPLMELNVSLQPTASLFDDQTLGPATYRTHPVNMEALDQQFGFVLYEHIATSSLEGPVTPGDYPRDRIIVYVNEKRIGTMDSVYDNWDLYQTNVTLEKGDKLQLLVENMGRVDYGPTLPDQRRGIVGKMTVGGTVLTGWKIYSLPLQHPPPTQNSHSTAIPTSKSPPIFYTGTFPSPPNTIAGSAKTSQYDTFLSIPNGTKGQVWINGFNLGRYWIVGPQQSLYLPAPLLRDAGMGNEIVVMELEPKGDVEMVAVGEARRRWFNRADPDRPS